MADNFFLDGTEFEGVTDDLRSTGSDLKADQLLLSNTLVRYNGCWGDDEIGKAFEKNYWGNAEEIRLGTATAGDGIIGTADGAKQSAENLLSVDEATAKWMDEHTKPQ